MYLYIFVFLSFGHARPEPLGITGQCARLSLISYFSPRDTTVISYVKSYFPNSLLPRTEEIFAFIFPRIAPRIISSFLFIFFSFFPFRESSRGRISICQRTIWNEKKNKSVPERIEFKEFFQEQDIGVLERTTNEQGRIRANWRDENRRVVWIIYKEGGERTWYKL